MVHLPTLASLLQTSYGHVILVKAGLLAGAMLLASGNFLRTVPALRRLEPSPEATILLRRLVAGETLLVAGAVAAAAVLSSLAPPPKALAGIGSASAHVGPGPVTRTISTNGYQLAIRVAPNRAAVPNDFSVEISRNGSPVRGSACLLASWQDRGRARPPGSRGWGARPCRRA